MGIEAIAEHRLRPEDDVAIARLLAACFATDFGGRSHFEQRHHLRLVWRETGDVVAHLAVLFRAVRLGDDLLTVAGIADVATAPDWRGRGLAAALLAEAVAVARLSLAQFVLLFGEARLYGAAGFVPVGNRITFADLAGARTRRVQRMAAEGLMVLPLGAGIWDGDVPLDLLGHRF